MNSGNENRDTCICQQKQKQSSFRLAFSLPPPPKAKGCPSPFVRAPGRRARRPTSATTAGSLATGVDPASNSLPKTRRRDKSPFNRVNFRQSRFPTDRVPVPPLQGERLVGSDVVKAQRSGRKDDVRAKFDDVFQVCDDCSKFGDFDIENVSNDFSVAGRLNRPESVEFFRHIGAPSYVIDSLTHGHKPFLSSEVPSYDRGNNKSFSEHHEFALKEIKNLIAQGKVELVSQKPRVVNPLSVAIEPTKKRLILDCSFLNRYVVVPSFKMDDVKTGKSFFKKGGFIFSFDMKDGYHHILIHESFRDYLGFCFTLDGKTYYARYLVCPFGLRDVPYLFTKVMRPLVSHWRRLGIENCLFLDDGFSCAVAFDKALADSVHVRQDLMRAGIVWSVKKSTWTPTQVLDWVGFTWNASTGILKIKDRRILKLKESALNLLERFSCPVRKLAGFVGQLVSMGPVLGDISRLKSRNCQIWVAVSPDWDSKVILRDSIKSELRFWVENIDRLNAFDCFPSVEPICINVIEGDASSTGCGSVLNFENIAARIFSEEERGESSTWREIANIHFSLYSFLDRIKNRAVKFRTDSQSAAKICKVGSMNVMLQLIAEEIFDLCLKNKITLVVEWIPRTQNEMADAVSRLADAIDVDDWGISDEFFEILNNKWGPVSIDLFANYYNTKCERFYSLFFSPKSSGIDAFTHSWSGENCLMVPPINLIPRALYHARVCACQAVLVVPLWTSSAFWPVLGNNYRDNVLDFFIVKGRSVLRQGLNKKSIFGSNSFQGDLMALKLKF